MDPIPPPPWLSAPPISQYSVDGIISELGNFKIEQCPAAPEEATPVATSQGVTQTWLPSAPASEEPVDGGYDMSTLEDALADCGRVSETNDCFDSGYHAAVLAPPYHHSTVSHSIWQSKPPFVAFGKVKKARKIKVCYVAMFRAPLLTANSLGCHCTI